MKTIIYYFTGTGNSLFAARKLAAELDECEVVSLVQAVRKNHIEQADVIGISLPNYAYRAPHLVERFLRILNQSPGDPYIFTVSTTAGNLGTHIPKIQKLLKHKNYQGAYTLFMPFNYLAFGDAGTKEDQKERTETAIREVRMIADKVRKREKHFDPVVKYFRTYVHPGIVYKMAYKMIPKMDRQYRATGKCTGCGTCSKICPVGNITMEANEPQWNHRCEQCWGCLHWCPSEAIQYGKASEGKDRYHHPSVSIKDMKIQAGNL